MALYSFFKATASASRRSPSLLLLHHSRRFTSAASGDRSICCLDNLQLSPAANSYGCLSSSAAYTADHRQIASPSVLQLLQSCRFTHASAAAGSPTLLQPLSRRFASKPDAETIRDEPPNFEWTSKIDSVKHMRIRDEPPNFEWTSKIDSVKHMRILRELIRGYRKDVNLVNSRAEVLKKRLDEIHRLMKESHSKRMEEDSDSVNAIWERQMPTVYERVMFSEDNENDFWGHVFIGRGKVSDFLGKLVFINAGIAALLFLTGMLLTKDKSMNNSLLSAP